MAQFNAQELKQIGPYVVRRFIAEGGMAWVFEVTDRTFEGRRLALKMLKPAAAQGDEFQRFVDEARLQATIDHPNLVTIFDFGRDEETDCLYYTMTYVDGPTMAQRLAEGGAMSVKEASRLFFDLLDGLSALHRRGIVHRDIKPANILIDEDGRGRVADLGIAREADNTGLTKTGMAVGTVIYMSAEQARGQPVDPSSDVFSVGLTLYEALTGQIVYDGVEDVDSTNSHDILGYLVSLGRTGEEIDITYPAEPRIPVPIQKVIEKACSFHKEDRYQNAAEMSAALEEALREPQEPMRQGLPMPVMIGAGAVLLVVIALAVYLGVVRPIWDREVQQEHATEVMALAKGLEEQVPLLLDRLKDLESAPGPVLLDPAEQDIEDARRYLGDGEEDFQIESFGTAGKSFERSIRTYEDTCQLLVTEFIAEEADTRSARATDRVKGLEAVGAAEYVKDDWAALQAAMAGLAPPAADASPCSAASTHLDRIDAARASAGLIATVESGLGEVWPRLAATARNEADAARKVAESENVDAIEVTRAVEAGREAFARAERSEEARDYPAARDEYEHARDSFQLAAKVAPAARARADVRHIEEEVATEGARIGTRVSLLTSRADEAFSRSDYAQAEQLYREAISGMKGDLKKDELERVVREVRTKALATREVAIREGAEKSASIVLARADKARDEAEAAFADERIDEAETKFQTAHTEYGAARDASIEAMTAAREAESQARRALETLVPGGRCEKLESSTARGECGTASDALAAGSESLAALDAPNALLKLRAAREGLDRAATSENTFIETKPRPPELVKRTPQRDRVEVYRNQSQRFIIEAKDANRGDRLRYTWSFDGRPVQLSGPDVEFTPETDGTIQVTVSDGRDSFTESWELVLKNRKPKLSVEPRNSSIGLTVGQSQSFNATANDPDGEKVELAFVLDGRKVAGGSSYRFTADKAANHRLEIVASDASGAKTVLTKEIRVSSIPVVAKKTTTAPSTPLPPAPAPPAPAPADQPAWKTGVLTTLGEYERALEAKDMRRLEQVWLLPSDSLYRMRWESKFSREESLDVGIDVRSMERRGDQVSVVFDQTEASPTKTRTWRYEALLVPRGSNWQIVENKLQK